MSKTFKILSIDGGGFKGLYSAIVLRYIEEKFGRITDHFDMLCGTSTGGIIALGLAAGRTAREIEDFYLKYGKIIFPAHNCITRSARLMKQLLWGSKYNNKKLRDALTDLLGSKLMRDSNSLLVVPSHKLVNAEPKVFKYPHKEGKFDKDGIVPMVDVALATSAAPTFFPIKEIFTDKEHDLFIDGGIWANNPSLCGVIEAIQFFVGTDKEKFEYDKYQILSISSIKINNGWNINNRKNRGIISWRQKLLEAVMDSSSYANDFYTRKLLDITNGEYFRIPSPPDLSQDHCKDIALDKASAKTIKTIQGIALKLASDYTTQFQHYEKILRFFENEKTYLMDKEAVDVS